MSAAVAAFVEAQRTKRAARQGHARIHDENLYRLLDGLLAARHGRGPAVGTDKEESYMHHFTAIDALPAVWPQESTPEPGARISVFASEGKYSPNVLQVTGTAAELLAFAEGIRDAVHLVEMRQLAESMDPIPGTVTS